MESELGPPKIEQSSRAPRKSVNEMLAAMRLKSSDLGGAAKKT